MERQLARAGLQHRPLSLDLLDDGKPEHIAIKIFQASNVLNIENNSRQRDVHGTPPGAGGQDSESKHARRDSLRQDELVLRGEAEPVSLAAMCDHDLARADE